MKILHSILALTLVAVGLVSTQSLPAPVDIVNSDQVEAIPDQAAFDADYQYEFVEEVEEVVDEIEQEVNEEIPIGHEGEEPVPTERKRHNRGGPSDWNRHKFSMVKGI